MVAPLGGRMVAAVTIEAVVTMVAVTMVAMVTVSSAMVTEARRQADSEWVGMLVWIR